MKKADVIGLVAGLGAAGVIVYELWKNQPSASGTVISGTVISGTTAGTGNYPTYNPPSTTAIAQAAGVVPTSTGQYDPGVGTSPYGSNPSVTPTNCGSGYTPTYVNGYGWTCKENGTPTQQFVSSLPTIAQTSQNTGDPISQYGIGISGSNAQADAAATLAQMQSQYGGTWHVYLQNGQYSVLPASRVQYIQSIGGNVGTLVQ